MKDLHKMLVNSGHFLRSLALVDMKLDFPLDDLAHFVDVNDCLTDLDLSGNNLLPLHFVNLLKALAFDKTLINVNLSWNSLINQRQIEKEDVLSIDLTEERMNIIIEKGLTNLYLYDESLDYITEKQIPQLIIECFSNMIRHNNNIKCINLDSTGLSSRVLVGFVPAMRHAKSLLCFHLAQNPGVNPRVKKYWRERLRIAPKETPLVININRERDDLSQPLPKIKRMFMTQNEVLIREYKVANYRSWRLEEASKISANRQKKKIINKQEIQNVVSAH